MASLDVLQIEQDLLSSRLLDPKKGDSAKSRGISIERKIEFLESLTGKFMVQFWQHMVTLEWSKVRGKSLTEKEKLVLNSCFAAIRFIKLSQAEKLIALDAETVPVISNLMVSNRRSRRWLNDRLLMELVPRLDAEEIRGLFAPPPWGADVPPSPFCLTNCGEWDKFRNIDMDKEANIITTLNSSSLKRKGHVNADKIAVLNAWHRVDCRTREALRRSFLSELIEGYEDCIRAFIKESGDGDGDGDGDVLVLKVQDSFHRLLLHGVCEFYNLVSVTVTESKDSKSLKMTRIKKKKRVSPELPSITLSHFLKMSKEGIW